MPKNHKKMDSGEGSEEMNFERRAGEHGSRELGYSMSDQESGVGSADELLADDEFIEEDDD